MPLSGVGPLCGHLPCPGRTDAHEIARGGGQQELTRVYICGLYSMLYYIPYTRGYTVCYGFIYGAYYSDVGALKPYLIF